MVSERTLDVRHLEPCEPLEQSLAACATLGRGELLRITHRREPFPLYRMLVAQGFGHRTLVRADGHFEVLVWHLDDENAGAAAGAIR